MRSTFCSPVVRLVTIRQQAPTNSSDQCADEVHTGPRRFPLDAHQFSHHGMIELSGVLRRLPPWYYSSSLRYSSGCFTGGSMGTCYSRSCACQRPARAAGGRPTRTHRSCVWAPDEPRNAATELLQFSKSRPEPPQLTGWPLQCASLCTYRGHRTTWMPNYVGARSERALLGVDYK